LSAVAYVDRRLTLVARQHPNLHRKRGGEGLKHPHVQDERTHQNPTATTVRTFIPASAKVAMVSGTSSCSLSSFAVAP
jgi:hypothetical protein